MRFVVFDELIASPRILGGAAPRLSARCWTSGCSCPWRIPPENIISFNPTRDRDGEMARIASLLAVAGIDIALLSVDSRGHIGFHVSGSNLESAAGIVPVANRERWGAAEAFSLGLADLAKASRILLFAAGRNLAEIVQRLTEGSFDPTIPISVLQRHGNVTLIADAGALSRIERDGAHQRLLLGVLHHGRAVGARAAARCS